MRAVTEAVFGQKGLRFIVRTRSKVPNILTPDGAADLFSCQAAYGFVPGKDDLIREGTAGYIVSYGNGLYRSPLSRTLFSSPSPPPSRVAVYPNYCLSQFGLVGVRCPRDEWEGGSLSDLS